MAYRSAVGPRIRERRRSLGITQSALAARIGISPSYLNLIESGRRNIGGAVLKRIAAEIGVAIDELDGAAQRRLADDLASLAAEPLLAELPLDPASAESFAGQHEVWAQALVRLHRASQDRLNAVHALSDRLNHDPFLGDAVHSMLSRVAAIRSASEILETVEDVEPAQRARFLSIIASESARLSDVAQALASFFDSAHTHTRSITPAEEVDDFLLERGNHFPGLEQASVDFRAAARIEHDCDEERLAAYLGSVHDVQVRIGTGTAPEAAAAQPRAAWDDASRTLTLPQGVSRAARRFELAKFAAQLFHRGAPISAEIAGSSLLTSDAAKRRATRVLVSYLAAAILMPYDVVLEAAVTGRYDLDRLAGRFDASFEQVCHRLVTLQRPGAQAIPFAFLRVDAAGFVTKRYPLPHLRMPRHGSACPMWPVYQAFQSPGALVRQLAEFPNGARFLLLARTDEKPRPSFTMPRRLMSIMLACNALHADRTVYGESIGLSSTAPATPVGPNCRLCVRHDCWYRQEDPIIDA
ncbi:MAG: short-chain fatty acyl-CoA regulator family protein [Burkholderiaceae bacterium]|jgi:predicted transcriptional regulator/transcriptional regulator with XRE-family HTH domain|nr:short-chain fatty acyl-CoA regulator family protein [Burkholderiaceae bacterium]